MAETLRALASFALPVLAGTCLVHALWPAVPRRLAWSLGPLAGFAIAGSGFFLGVVLFDSATRALATSESLLVVALAGAIVTRWRRTERVSPPNPTFEPSPRDPFTRGIQLAAVAAVVLAATAFVFASGHTIHGGWDALAIWNMKARIIHRAAVSPMTVLTDIWIYDTQIDYPFLLSSLIARGWEYAGAEARVVLIGIAAMFMATLLGTLAFGLGLVAPRRRAWLGVALLAGTPFLALHAASLYADVAMASWMCGAVLLCSARDTIPMPRSALAIAGLLAGAAAATKNEGLLFVLTLLAARGLLAFWRSDWRTGTADLTAIAIGIAASASSVAAFKLVGSPDSPLVDGMTATTVLGRFGNWEFHRVVIAGILAQVAGFGRWWINPLPLVVVLVVAEVVISRRVRPTDDGSARGPATEAWWTPALGVLGMMAGFYLVYLFSPYDQEWHIGASVDRLLLQLWPMVLLATATVGARPTLDRNPAFAISSPRRIRGTFLVALLATAIGLAAAAYALDPVGGVRLELNRSVVVAGEDAYTLKVTGLEGRVVDVGYRFAGRAEDFMRITLDDAGEMEFDVSTQTPVGDYVFTRVRDVATGASYPVSGAITVEEPR